MLGYFLIDIIGASLAGFLFWIIVTELQKGDLEEASIFFAILVFGLLIDRSTKVNNLRGDKDSETN